MNDPQILYQIPDSGPPISRARLATVLWLVVETMIFAGMLSAFVITRKSAHEWPPVYENARAELIRPPRVDRLVPTINAGVLISAFVVALMAQRAARKRESMRCRLRLTTVAVLGSIFVGVVVWEFFHEAGRGVTIRSGSYGAYWTILTAAHALHVLAGVVWLVIALRVRASLPLVAIDSDRVDHLGLYWGFVTIVWIVLLVLLHIY